MAQMTVKRPAGAPAAPRAPGVTTPKPGLTPMTASASPQGGVKPVTGVNQNPGSHQYGQQYVVQQTTGGVFHVYGNGQQIFVPAATQPASQSAASQAAAAPKADPRDAQYYSDTGQDTFDRNNKINDITTQDARDKTDTQEALRRLLENQPKAIQNAREAANRQGLFNSGKLGETEGTINTTYARQSGDMQSDADRRAADRQSAIAAIQGGASLADVTRLLEATDRQTTRDTGLADAGALAPPDAAVAATPAVASSAQTRTVKGKKQYRWPNGTWHSRPK